MVPLILAAKVMALVEVPQFGPPESPPSAVEVRAARRGLEELGKVLRLLKGGAEAVLLTQLASVRTEGRPEGKGLYPGDILVWAEEKALKAAKLRFAQAAFGTVKARGLKLRAPKVLVVLDTKGCFAKYRDLAYDREAIEEVLRLLGVDFKVYIPPVGPTDLAPLPERLLQGVDIVLDAAEIVGWGWDEGAKRALREFLSRGGALIAIEAGCYRYVTKPGKGEAPVPEGGTLGICEAEAIHGGTGPRSESLKAESPFFLRLPAIEIGPKADEFRRTGFKPLGPGVVTLASDAAGVAQVLLKGRVLLVGPRIVSHVHDMDFSGVSDFDRAYNFYNARLLFNAIALFSGRAVEFSRSGPRWSFRPRWAKLWELAKGKVFEAFAALGVREGELEGAFDRYGAFAPVVYLLKYVKAQWRVARVAALHLAAGEPREALEMAKKAMEAASEGRRRLDWFVADQGRYGELLLRFSRALTESVERGIPADEFARACALANAAVASAKNGGMQQAVSLLERALEILRRRRGR